MSGGPRADIAVIGGGASGLAAAIAAARRAPGARICLLERGERVGRKLLATGNGRCNLLNTRADRAVYPGGAELAASVLGRFPPADILAFFESLGLRACEEEDGRVYPLCGQASAVLDVLRMSCAELGVEEVVSFDAAQVSPQAGGGFLVCARDGRRLRAERLLVCAGGQAAPKLGGTDAGCGLLGGLGHPLVPRRPALSPLETPPEAVRALKGLRFRGAVALLVDGKQARAEEGEILFAETGLSGIAVMQLAREAGDALRRGCRVEAELRFLPEGADRLYGLLRQRAERFPSREAGDLCTGLVARRIGQQLCLRAGVRPLSVPCSDVPEGSLRTLASLLAGWRLPVTRVRGFDSAQVTAGGADGSAFFPETLGSRLVPGLYAAGEVLDVDGSCGGFNLAWAWASGLLAGESAAASLRGGSVERRHAK